MRTTLSSAWRVWLLKEKNTVTLLNRLRGKNIFVWDYNFQLRRRDRLWERMLSVQFVFMDDPAELAGLFEDFEPRRWQSAQDPFVDCPEHRLFWRSGENVPPRLLLLDAPDVDSDVAVNWQRARAIRQAADVLLAVLTQQKYNDAAVKQFFRAAVEADKPIVVLFNQCNLTTDLEYWPQWLSTFCDQTGARPDLVYVIPYDRAAAEALQLPFYSVGRDGRQPLGEAANLRDELASLHFDAIKIRTFRGALARVLDR